MARRFVFFHSPVVDPACWRPVAQALVSPGHKRHLSVWLRSGDGRQCVPVPQRCVQGHLVV